MAQPTLQATCKIHQPPRTLTKKLQDVYVVVWHLVMPESLPNNLIYIKRSTPTLFLEV